MKDKERRITHPAFGMISACRIHHQPEHLFGSDIEHMNSVILRITTAEQIRDEHLHVDRFHSNKNIVEIQLTEHQFAALITTMNVQGGTPCTLRHIKGEKIPDPPSERQNQVFERELHQAGTGMIAELTAIEKELDALINGDKPPGKIALRDLLKKFHYALCAVSDNMPFLYKQYVETLDNAASDAETALHGRVIGMFQQLGLDATKGTGDVIPKLLGEPPSTT